MSGEMNVLSSFNHRGFIHQCSDFNTLMELTNKEKIVAYIGFDATADSLHVGHLLSILALKKLGECGHSPIILIGGGTTKIGDPSFKDKTRPLLEDEEIKKNEQGIESVIKKIINSDNIKTLNNREWIDDLKFISFLRDIGKHFSVNRMLSFDSVKNRIEREQSLSLLEFNYMVLQAFDFLELNKKENCLLQMGGSDQWGNIVNGIELVRKVTGKNVFGLTFPLLMTSSGKKMGKSESGTIWLDAKKTTPYDFWQFWRNIEDGDVERFLKMFTSIELEEIKDIVSFGKEPINNAKVILANNVTSLVHGEEESKKVEKQSTQIFKEKIIPKNLEKRQIKKETKKIISILLEIKIIKSKNEGRNMIKNGGVRINGKKIENEIFDVDDNEFNISFGKKWFYVIRE